MSSEGRKLDVKHCSGCEDDFYNGKNPYGVTECWGRSGAVMDKYMLVHIDQRPPYKGMKLQSMPTCFKKKRYVKVKPTALTKEGYWK